MSQWIDEAFPSFRGEWFVYQDSDILVVDKPADLSVQSRERLGSDLLDRVRLFVARQDGTDPSEVYLAAHQHLERDTSGIVLLSRRPPVNASLANLPRNSQTQATWLAAVMGELPSRKGHARVQVAADRRGIWSPTRQTRHATTVEIEWEVIEAAGNRKLLEVRSRLTSARHIRAALAAMRGIGLAGDCLFDGSSAPRLMLHLNGVRFVHPQTGAVLQLRTRLPAMFRWWMQLDRNTNRCPDLRTLTEIVLDAAARRHALASGRQDAFRVFHGEAEGLPGIDIDRFAQHLVVWIDEQVALDCRRVVVEAATQLKPDGIYVKIRPRNPSRVVDPRRQEIAPRTAEWGHSAPAEFVVNEGNLRFWVRLGDGLSTGLFLDQRDNRAWVATHSAGRRVLNLFAFTCAFTCAAASGGALRTVSVDSSQRALDMGARNLAINGQVAESHALICDDVLSWLPRARAAGTRFELIILDPPSFSTTHKHRFSLTKDLVTVAASCISLISDSGGIVVVCTNCRAVRMAQMRRWIIQAGELAGRLLQKIEPLPTQLDFPVMPGGEAHMKAWLVEVGQKFVALPEAGKPS